VHAIAASMVAAGNAAGKEKSWKKKSKQLLQDA